MAINRQSLGIIKKPKKIITKKKKIDMGNAGDRLARRTGIKLPPKIQNDLIPLEERQPISIIIPAYESENFIEECLDSIENQTYFENFNDYEVLVGVDGCQKTLNKLKEIRHKYRNLRIFMMDSNMGTYVTSNTLLEISQFNYILRFDSDDYLSLNAFEEIMKYNEYDIIRFKANSFNDKEKSNLKISGPHDGVFLAKKCVFDELGGYKPWRCAADTDFKYRAASFDFKKINVETPLYYRRVHGKSLTNSPKTKFGSELRLEYKKQLGKGDKKIIPIINEYEIIK